MLYITEIEMWRILIYRIKKLFTGLYRYENRKFDDSNSLYELAYNKIKNAKYVYDLQHAKKYLYELDELTISKYPKVMWMKNRNNTLKMLWVLKYTRLKKRG